MRALAITLTLLASAASVGLLWTNAIPLGVPGEWTWARLSYSVAGMTWGAVVSGLSGGLYLMIAWRGQRHLEAASRWQTAAWLALLASGGFVWLWGAQSAAIEGVGLGKSPNVLFYRRTEGYYWQARYEVDSVPEFLAGYEELMSQQDYLHIGTHPPGLTLMYCGLLAVCERSPELVRVLRASRPTEVQESIDLISTHVRGSGAEFTETDSACLWLAALLTQSAAALTVMPLYGYLRLSCSRTAAWRATVFWPLVPAIAIFLPKSDVLYPLVGMTAAWLFRAAWFRSRQKLRLSTVVYGLLGGFAIVGGLLLSLAFLPVLALIGMQWLCDVWTEPQTGRTSSARVVHEMTVAVCLFGCFLIALGSVLTLLGYNGMNLANVWRWNFNNHALFYEHNVRTYGKWLLVNPLELTLAAGVPVVALVTWGAWARRRDWGRWLASPVVPWTVVWGLLWLSGKNMGEAARLWILLLPWLVASTVNAFAPAPEASTVPSPTMTAPVGSRLWLGFVGLQWLVGALTVLRIDGFHFTELAAP